jgi:hypothetical protein
MTASMEAPRNGQAAFKFQKPLNLLAHRVYPYIQLLEKQTAS